MDTAVLIISLLGILIGFLMIRRGKGIRNVFIGLMLVVFLSVYFTYFFYAGPRAAGDRFADNLASLDVTGLRGDLCSDTLFNQAFSQIGGAVDLGLGVVGSTDINRISHANYSPFTKEYRFSFTVAPLSDDRDMTLWIRPATPFTFCIFDLRL